MAEPGVRQRVVLAEDHAAVAEQLRGLLATEYEVVETVGDGRALVETVKALAPDVIVADVGMPVMDGLAAARAILDEQPAARIVFVTVRDEPTVIRHALSLGALAYVIKADAGEELVPAVRSSLGGRRFLSASAQAVLRDQAPRAIDLGEGT
jgi:DNA-binding NarL/FixJ family response regulator